MLKYAFVLYILFLENIKLTNPFIDRLLRVGQDIAPAKQVATVCPAKWLTRTKWPRKLLLSYPSLPTTLQEAGNLSLFNEGTGESFVFLAEILHLKLLYFYEV